jgi:hypothetical protein
MVCALGNVSVHLADPALGLFMLWNAGRAA